MTYIYLNGRWIIIALILTCIAVLVGRNIWREFREALAKDKEEGTGKHVRGKLAEYGIVLLVGIVALVTISYLKVGPLQGLSESLWGKPPEPIDSPFFRR